MKGKGISGGKKEGKGNLWRKAGREGVERKLMEGESEGESEGEREGGREGCESTM